MRAEVRGAAGILAACALTAAAAPVATADSTGSWRVSVTPSTVAPGGQVTLSSSGCQVPTVKVDAPIFDPVELNEGHSATAHVYPDANRGAEYEVTFTCKRKTKTVPLKIAGGGHTGGQTGGHTGGRTGGQHTGVPHRGVKAGEGGAFSDISPTQLALGGALVAGVLGFTVMQVRRRDE
ncbi:hypothetical protein RCO28_10030 [Streptomyces sp. LHD-70]|uniref:hypothetical protein n=1 Tax=Streptomyces sp. LHD-70 TaxID=3072140 RepID=UPI00280CFB16|nr:hypothetical protein [Streptomyces sp. LHD-70]MDQ8702824.1 hypothetical protein [Streptomyces sp. LHD-70]